VLQHVSLEVRADEAPGPRGVPDAARLPRGGAAGSAQGTCDLARARADDFEATLDRPREHGFDPQQHRDLWERSAGSCAGRRAISSR